MRVRRRAMKKVEKGVGRRDGTRLTQRRKEAGDKVDLIELGSGCEEIDKRGSGSAMDPRSRT